MLAPTTGTTKKIRPISVFRPLDWQRVPWRDRSPIVLLTGAAGGGKSRLAAEKLHAYCLKYPGATALIARKVKTAMAAGTILFLRRKIVGNDPNVRWVDSPKNRFEYRNGSVLQFIGLLDEDARENLKSIGQDGAVDIAWMEEAVQFEEEDMNAMAARMRGRAAPWRQIILTCNPDAPTHWIKRRLINGGEARVYYSQASDNYHNPADYQAWLATLTGTDYQRLVLGKWIQASGLVYENWVDRWDYRLSVENFYDRPGNVTDEADYVPGGGAIYWCSDDGYAGKVDEKTGQFTADSHPRVFLLAQEKGDGHLDIFYEDYRIKTEVDPQLAEVLSLPLTVDKVRAQFADLFDTDVDISGRELIDRIRAARERKPDDFYPEPEYIALDSAAATLKGMLINRNFYTRNKPSNVEESIKAMRPMVAPDENGWRRIRVHPRCKHLRAEMASYRRDPQTGKPVAEYDHGPSAARYFAWTKRLEG